MTKLRRSAAKLAAICAVVAVLAAPASAQTLTQVSSPAAPVVCEPLPRPTVELTFTNNPPIQHNERSVRELAGLKVDTTFSHSVKEAFLLTGAMVANYQPKYALKFSSRTMPDGRICSAPFDIAITVTYNPTIYVAREAPAGSCDYTVILQHEVRHVNTDILTFNEYLPQLKSAMEDTIGAMPVMGPFDAADQMRVDEALYQQIQTVFVKKITELNQVRFNRQQMIDTRQEYMRTSRACPADSPLNTALANPFAGLLAPTAMPVNGTAPAP